MKKNIVRYIYVNLCINVYTGFRQKNFRRRVWEIKKKFLRIALKKVVFALGLVYTKATRSVAMRQILVVLL